MPKVVQARRPHSNLHQPSLAPTVFPGGGRRAPGRWIPLVTRWRHQPDISVWRLRHFCLGLLLPAGIGIVAARPRQSGSRQIAPAGGRATGDQPALRVLFRRAATQGLLSPMPVAPQPACQILRQRVSRRARRKRPEPGGAGDENKP